jgi:hypothetical protein
MFFVQSLSVSHAPVMALDEDSFSGSRNDACRRKRPRADRTNFDGFDQAGIPAQQSPHFGQVKWRPIRLNQCPVHSVRACCRAHEEVVRPMQQQIQNV